MTILLTGGGTGGHITPILAVAHELKKQYPSCTIVYVGERHGKYTSMLTGNTDIDEFRQIFAGKFRRYHGESWLTRMLDIKTLLLNMRDFFLFILGVVQSIVVVRRIKPDVIFLKGGFVGLPVGLAAAFWRRPFVTHDSDALPGIANRIVARWASVHATAMPASYYKYPKSKIIQVGVLVTKHYVKVTSDLQRDYRHKLGLPVDARVLTVTGGSNGSTVINKAIALHAQKMLEKNPKLHIIHQVGIGKRDVYMGFTHPRLIVYELLKDLHVYSGASDVIVTRAGANTIAEFGIQSKPCIVIPNPLLTGGHQLLNADYLARNEAAVIVDENELNREQGSLLWQKVEELLGNSKLSRKIADNLERITIKDAASKLAKILIDVGGPNV